MHGKLVFEIGCQPARRLTSTSAVKGNYAYYSGFFDWSAMPRKPLFSYCQTAPRLLFS